MNKDIETIKMPEWLSRDNFTFDVNTVLENSLYYPCACFDAHPVKYFMGNVYSFVNVDYGVSKGEFLREIDNHGFLGYHIIHRKPISQDELTPAGWKVHIYPERNDGNPGNYQNGIQKPFCEWIIFERDSDRDDSYNPKRFSLLYLCADGAAAYQAMYLSNSIKPRIIAIIQPGHGFGGNWSDFTDRTKIFARSVFYNNDLLPEYLINGGIGPSSHYDDPIWSEFNSPIGKINAGESTLKIWKCTVNIS